MSALKTDIRYILYAYIAVVKIETASPLIYSIINTKKMSKTNKTTQKSLTNYFNVELTRNINKTRADCFIYDPGNRRAYFAIYPETGDEFVVKCPKEQVTLYLRPTPETKPCVRISTDVSIPILKSNLQKAVRRFESEVAMASAAAILWYGKEGFSELVRRLGIIYIEDVCLIDHYCIVCWLMIASAKSYVPSYLDEWILIQIAGDLARTNHVYEDDKHPTNREGMVFDSGEVDKQYKNVHELQTSNDAIKCVYLRSLYGGMKGDMVMLQRSVNNYIDRNRNEPFNTSCWEEIERCVPDELEILSVAIDFHPLPHMLSWIEKQISPERQVSKDTIKHMIWFVYSGVNYRKKWTMDKSNEYSARPEFREISIYVKEFIDKIIL